MKIAAALLLAVLAAGQKNNQAEVQLKAAMHKELVDGDLKGALEQYQKILASFGSNRAVGAKALVQIGQCYEKLGKSEARSAYERVLREFADQPEPARVARERLAALEQPAKAKESGMVVRRVLVGRADLAGSLSPEGSYLSFTDWNTGNLAIRELATGQQRPLTKDGAWSSPEYTLYSKPSPDGKQVAYDWQAKDHPELRLIGLDGSGPRVLYRGEGVSEIVPFGWSPDDRYVLVTLTLKKDKTCQIALVSVGDGSARVLRTFDQRIYPQEGMTFSPDGRHIAYTLRMQTDPPQRDIFVLAADGRGEIPLVQHPADDQLLGWSPDGKWILFASDRSGATDAWVIPVADGKPQGPPQLVRKDLGRIWPLGFMRDGAYYYTLLIGGPDVYIATVDVATGKVLAPPGLIPQRFLGSNVGPGWSPDGKRLLYISRRGPVGPAFNIPTIRSMETGRERDLSPKLNFLNQARWSPDGRSILAICYDRTDRRGICRIDAETSEVTLLVENKAGENRLLPKGCPDGKSIIYYYVAGSGKLRSIRMHNLETGEEKDVLRDVAWRFDLSRDGRQLAFHTEDPATKEMVLKVMPLAGGEPRELFRSKELDVAVAWTPDGRRVLLESGDSLWSIPVDDGKPQKIDLGMKGVRGARLHPDGRRLAFWVEDPEWRNELWVMEHFLPEN